ncbi:MAG: PRD domain-containing protein [Solobacterium sp.]|jgi:sigma-54 dependent transcriptional regulator of gfr operon|nr:PRD domain-containing protein [Solobacterium sp.]MCH4265634.1 PRD domain-containing protein [Solobacterium sp.]
MNNKTKEQIKEYLEKKTKEFNLSMSDDFTTNEIADHLHLSRSVTSQYLNELGEEKVILKIKSRPVYFFDIAALEKKYRVSVKDLEFMDVEELLEHLRKSGPTNSAFDSLVGYDGSLQNLIDRSVEIFEYPPNGLPLLIYGDDGTGKYTLANQICKNSVIRGGVLNKKAEVVNIELGEHDAQAYEKIDKLLHENHANGMAVIISHVERIDQKTEQILIDYLNSDVIQHRAQVHLIFLSGNTPSSYMSADLQKTIPLQVHLRRYDQRPIEEREALVISKFQEQQKLLKRKIQVSSNVVRTLMNSKFSNNIRGIDNAVRLMCAHANMSDSDGTIMVHSYDMPQDQLENIQITLDDVSYIDCDKYIGHREVDLYIDFFNAVLLCCQEENTDEMIQKFTAIYNDIVNHLLLTNSDTNRTLMGMEVALSNIVNAIVQNHYVNIPGNFNFVLAKLTYIYNQYSHTFEQWEHERHDDINSLINRIRKEFVTETIIADEMNQIVQRNLEFKLSSISLAIMSLILYRYNSELHGRKMFGIIICHGYSTATSIASAVNTLIGSYVFDSIDMPIDTTVAEIEESLKDKVQRINQYADVVIMVDMGSLEQIDGSFTTNRNVAIINSVTTKMALNIGYKIVHGETIDHIFENAENDYKVEHKIFRNKTKNVIVFTSESGIETAQRVEDLFKRSIPVDIPVEYQLAPYDRFQSDSVLDIDKNENILFITGTDDPEIKGTTYIPLEGIITTGNLDIISNKLKPFLNEEQLKQLIVNIRRNFTLINVVQYLTILNPQTLLDYITVAVDILQKKYHVELEGRRLVGIYIHICCLVERLVTKVGVIKESAETKEFVKNNPEFIKLVNESFAQITNHYHIVIPESEMMYLYSFIDPKEN